MYIYIFISELEYLLLTKSEDSFVSHRFNFTQLGGDCPRTVVEWAWSMVPTVGWLEITGNFGITKKLRETCPRWWFK